MKFLLGGIGQAFADRNFRLYSIGSVLSWLSFFVQSVAVAWTAWDLTHSTEWLAIVALSDALPNIVLMPIGGVIADRYDRFRVLLASYVFATLQAALLAGFAVSGQLTVERLAVLAAMHGACHAFSIPAAYGLLPRFIARDRLASAISVAAAYTQLGLFAGPALAGWVIQHFGTAIAFATNVVGYGIFFVCAALMRTPTDYAPITPPKKSFFTDFADGIRAIMGNGGILGLLTLMLFGDALTASIRQMSSAFSATVLNAGVEGVATMLACGGIGATLSALWLAHGGAKRASLPNIIWSFLGFLGAVALLMLSVNLVMAGAAMIALGCFFEVCRTGAMALLQISVADTVRGRVMSTQFLLLRLAGAIGVAGVGGTAGLIGLRAPILLLAAGGFLVWLATFLRRDHIRAAFHQPAEATSTPLT